MSIPVQRSARLLGLPILLVLLVVAPWPAASADLGVSTSQDPSQHYDILTTGSTNLDAPQNLTLAVGASSVRLAWDPPSDPSDLHGYVVYRVPGPDSGEQTRTFTLPASRTTLNDRSADPGAVYVYFVTALSQDGSESTPSAPAATIDQYYPHCAVVSVYLTSPYYNVQMSCLFPVP